MKTSVLVASCGVLLGCPNPSTYGTPRTLPAGQDQHTIAVEAIYVNSQPGGRGTAREDGGLPMSPSYHYRRGLTDTVDLGARATNLSGLGADVKWNFVRGSIDLAIDPGVQWAYVPIGHGFSAFYLHAPVLVGLNVTRRITLVLTPGAMFAVETGSPPPGHSVVRNGGALARLGVGVNLRLGARLALMPEATAMRALNDSGGIVVVAGLGIKLGAQPFMDGESAATLAAPTAASPSTHGAPPQAPVEGTRGEP